MKEYYRTYIEQNTDDPNGLSKIVTISENLMSCIDENTENLVEALNKNSKSSNYLAKIGIFVGVVGTIATAIGTIYGILSYLK